MAENIINKNLISLFRGQPMFGQTSNMALSSYPSEKMLSGKFFSPDLDLAKNYAKNSSFPSVVKEMKVPSNVLDKAYDFKSRLKTLPSKTFEMINMSPKVVIANQNMLKNYNPSINIPATLSSNFNQGLGFLKQNAFRALAMLGTLPAQAGLASLTPTKMGNAELSQMPQGSPSQINNGGRDPNQGNTQTGFGRSGMGRDPNDKMAMGGLIDLYRNGGFI